jgi:hypothetical protein
MVEVVAVVAAVIELLSQVMMTTVILNLRMEAIKAKRLNHKLNLLR